MAHPAVKDFLRLLDGFDRSKRRCEVFADFCEMAYCAIAKQASPYADQRETLEKQYMQAVARYRNKDEVRKMPELLAIASTVIGTGGLDFMGQVAGELGALDAGLGQFFTPYEVSHLIAVMNLGDAASVIAEHGFITIQEPAAGAGGMLVAAADTLEAEGLSLDDAWMEAIELSRSTFYMLYVQLALRGIAGRVICGNALSCETFISAFTPAAACFVARHGHPFARQIAAEKAAEDTARKKADLIAMLEIQHMPAI